MNDQELIDSLLKRQEADDLDFKSRPYKLDSNNEKSRFIKDVLAMANTPRAGSAYILIGVIEKSGKATEYPGVNAHPDEAELGRIVAGKTEPVPRFTYRQVFYNEVELGLIEIPHDQPVPIMPRSDFEILRRGCVYMRRNTQNTEADREDLFRISQWAQGQNQPPRNHVTGSGSWEQFYRACDGFDSRRVYIAILAKEQRLDVRDWTAMASIQWSILIDLDTDTDAGGNYAVAKEPFSERHALRISALEDSPMVSTRSTVWIAASGLDSRPTTKPSSEWRDWNKSKVPRLERTMGELAKITEPAPVTFIVFGGEANYVSTTCEIVDRAFPDRVAYVFANLDTSLYQDSVARFEASSVAISLPSICQGLRELQQDSGPAKEIQFPKFHGGTIAIEPERARWLEEQLVLVHLDVDSVEDSQPAEMFLKGGTISWSHLKGRVDIDREVCPKLERRIREELELRETRRVNLRNWPGAGATTVARRVAWNLQREFPTVVAHEIQPQETAERLRYLFGITRLPILVVIDLPGMTKEVVDRFYDTLRRSHTPAVLFIVERRFDNPVDLGSNYLDAALTTTEAFNLASVLTRHVPGRKQALEALVNESDRRKRSPFYFGLTAYGRDFQALESYVETRLSKAAESEPVREAILLMAFTYYYGQVSLSPQIFASVFGIPASKHINVPNVIPEYIRELLVEENQKIRPAHQLIAEEILQQELEKRSGNQRNWHIGLADLAVRFIDILSDLPHQNRGIFSDILRAVLIERGSAESPSRTWETVFSKFLNDVPSVDGRRRVLEHLTDAFPEESHFWAHLGRFYSGVIQDHSKAHEAHQKALRLSPNDSLLHHMAGMGWRAELYGLLDSITKDNFHKGQEDETFRLLNEATQEFNQARALDRRSEYNYVSQVQMILRVVTSIGNAKGYQHEPMRFMTSPENDSYQELLDQAQNLLSDLTLIKGDESPSQLQSNLQASIERLYGKHSEAIERLTNVLDRGGSYRPPVRRSIIRTYVARREGAWDQLTDRELSRVVELAKDNIEEEPASDYNLRLWLRGVRMENALSVDLVTERLAYKRLQNPSLDTTYYLYIMKFLQLLSGDLAVTRELPDLIKECSRSAQDLSRTTTSFEWLGKETGLAALVHFSTLGKWDVEKGFWSNTQHLKAVRGRIAKIHNQGNGEIELLSGLRVFFIPSRAVSGGYIPGQDIGREVEFFLGFSYEGLRAWSVHDPDSDC